MSRTKNVVDFDDIPPTQPIPDMEDDDEEEPMEEGEDDFPEQPDLGWFFQHWELTDLQMIAICRTFANYISAKVPKDASTPRKRVSK